MVIELLTWRKKFIQEEGGLPPSCAELPCMASLQCVLSNAEDCDARRGPLKFPSVMGPPPASQGPAESAIFPHVRITNLFNVFYCYIC